MANEMLQTDHVIGGPMRGLEKNRMDVTNSVVWQDFASCKRRADKYGEAYNMLLEAILAAI